MSIRTRFLSTLDNGFLYNVTLYNKKRVNPTADSSTVTLLRLHSSHDASLGIPTNLTEGAYGSTMVLRVAFERLPRDSISRV